MRRINVLGVELRDYSVKESMRLVTQYLNNGCLDVICFLTTDVLVEAKDNAELKVHIESMDMTIATTADILKTAEPVIKSRMKEVENNMFFSEFMKKIGREKRTVFLLAKTEEAAEAMEKNLKALDGRITVVGKYIMDNLTGNEDIIINEINGIIPDVVFSMLPTPRQEQLIFDNRMKVNAKLWVALKENVLSSNLGKPPKVGRLYEMIDKKIFQRVVSKYNSGRDKKE